MLWPQQHRLCQSKRVVSAKQTESLGQEGTSLTAPGRTSLHNTPTRNCTTRANWNIPYGTHEKGRYLLAAIYSYRIECTEADNNDQTYISVIRKHRLYCMQTECRNIDISN